MDNRVEIVDASATAVSVSRYVQEMREKRQMKLVLESFKVKQRAL
jgi:hypothetical protein